MADRVALELGRFLEGMGAGAVIRDRIGPAVYQVEPSWLTAILCRHCNYVGLVMSLPARAFTWTCSRCGRGVALDPPAIVRLAPRPADGSRASRLQ